MMRREEGGKDEISYERSICFVIADNCKLEQVVSELILQSTEEADYCLARTTPTRVDINHYRRNTA